MTGSGRMPPSSSGSCALRCTWSVSAAVAGACGTPVAPLHATTYGIRGSGANCVAGFGGGAGGGDEGRIGGESLLLASAGGGGGVDGRVGGGAFPVVAPALTGGLLTSAESGGAVPCQLDITGRDGGVLGGGAPGARPLCLGSPRIRPARADTSTLGSSVPPYPVTLFGRDELRALSFAS